MLLVARVGPQPGFEPVQLLSGLGAELRNTGDGSDIVPISIALPLALPGETITPSGSNCRSHSALLPRSGGTAAATGIPPMCA